jgi:hypothetical protein
MIKLTVEKFKTERVVDGDNREGILRVDGQFNHENGRWKTTRNRSSQTTSRNSDRDRAMQMQLDEMETLMKDFLLEKSDKWQMENSGESEPELQFPDADGGTDDEDYNETGSDDMNMDQGYGFGNPLEEGEVAPATGKKTKRP